MFRLYLVTCIGILIMSTPITGQKHCTDCQCVHGKYAHTPININLGKTTVISVKGPACPSRHTKYTWKAVNGNGGLLYDLGSTSVPRVTWHPFRVAIRRQDIDKNNRIIVTKSDGLTTGRCVCHIDFILLDLYAHIDGSQIMRIGTKQKLPLYSHGSRDFLLPYEHQHLTHTWECEPLRVDMHSQYCVPGQTFATGEKIIVDGSRLIQSAKYKLTLHIKSPLTGMESTSNVYLDVEHGTQIPLIFNCHRNCLNYIYSKGRVMHVSVDCYTDCGPKRTYLFNIDNQFKEKNTHGHLRFMPPDKSTFNISFVVTINGVQSSDKGTFYLNEPPANGACTVTPTTGIPGDTLFTAECHDWQDKQPPLHYKLKAGHMLIDQTTDPHWEAYIPDVSELTFIICDVLLECTHLNVTLKLTKVQIPNGLEHIIEYMKQPGNNIKNLLIGGEFTRAVVKAILMMNNQTIETDKHILAQFHDFQAKNAVDVLQLGTMINQLMSSLGSITSIDTEAFLELLDKMCDGFKETVDSGEIKDIELDDLHDIAEEVIELIAKLTTHTEIFGDIQSILWEFEGGMVPVAQERAEVPPRLAHLVEHYGQFDVMNDTILKPINIRMHALCKTLELLHYIGIASSFRIHKGDDNFKIETENVQMTTIGMDDEHEITLVSPDLLATAILSKAMLRNMQRKLGGEDMTAQVVSFKQNPFWWFPTEHPITTAVFYFSAFSEEDQSIEDTQIDEPIKLDMLQTRTAKQAPVIKGAINASLEMPIYRVRTPAGAAVIINFTTTMVDMDVLVQCKRIPNLRQVRAANKRVKAANGAVSGVQYSDHNHASDADWCYVALVASEQAKVQRNSNYTFTVEIYECLTWNVHLDNPTWRTDGCEATHEDENITCRCYHMSVFAGRSYYSTAEEVVRERNVKTHLDINWYLVAFYLLILLIFIWLLLRVYDDMLKSGGGEKLVTELQENEQQRERSIALHITTGGHWTATCSANVLITLAGRTYTITQDPEKPLLKPHTTCVLELPIRANELSVPPKIMISQDRSGRYPSWFCASITIVNLENGEKWHCTVRRWIGAKPHAVQPDKEPTVPQAPTKTEKKQLRKEKWQKIKANYHDFFVCWFLFQPLFGPHQYGVVVVDRFVRSCIWIAKLAVIILLVCLWFGATTLDNYETERYEYEFLIDIIDWKFILFLIGCYFVTLLVELLMLLIAFPEFVLKYKKPSTKSTEPKAPKKRLFKKLIYTDKKEALPVPQKKITPKPPPPPEVPLPTVNPPPTEKSPPPTENPSATERPLENSESATENQIRESASKSGI